MRFAAGLLAGLSAATALVLAGGPARAHERPALFAMIEAGGFCSLGKDLSDGSPNQAKIGDNGCGAMGRLAIGAQRVPLAFGLDFWRLSVRHATDRDSADRTSDTTYSRIDLRERRLVIDAEAGMPIAFSLFGSKSRLLAGVRFADYELETTARQADAGVPQESMRRVPEFRGIGPRIGIATQYRLTDTVRIDTESGLAALFGRHRLGILDLSGTGAVMDQRTLSRRGTVINWESNLALTFAPSGHAANGLEISLGVRSEYWFKQVRYDAVSSDEPGLQRDRNGITPFVRGTLPLQ
jgi:hypothetical protein